jgi:hypothetical protein
MKTVIHVNRHHIAANRKAATALPVFTVKDYRQNRRGNHVEVLGPSTYIYSPDKPLPCGAVAWVETHAEVIVK